MSDFEELLNINVNDKTEKKEGLTYLTWSFAVSEFTKKIPDWTYEIKKFQNGDKILPYMIDDTGLMVFTSITANGITKEMWLPVMDSKNKAMKLEAYTYQTKNGEKTVAGATMFDVNKTIMRCLVKNMAMFGLGLYIYAGEDLPEQIIQDSKNVATENLDILNLINDATSEDELKSIYKKYKKQICANQEMLDLLTAKGKELKNGN